MTAAWRTVILACGWALILSVWGCAASGGSKGEQTIRIMTYNIHHGIGRDGTFDIDGIGKIIRTSRADIVALQDVDRGTSRVNEVDELTKLADLTKMTYTFSKSESLEGGEHGNGLLTRYPILEEKPILYALQGSRQQCSLMRLVLDVEGTNVIIMNTELAGNTSDTVQRSNVSELLSLAKGTGNVPTIFCCSLPPDADSSSFTPLLGVFTDSWTVSGIGDGKTYPSSHPDRRIDFIFVSKPHIPTDIKSPEVRLQPIGASILADSASDRRPMLVTLDIVSK